MLKKKLIGSIGFILLIYSLISAFFYSSKIWYSFFTIGGFLFLSSVNYSIQGKSIINIFEKNWKKGILIYLLFLIITVFIELIGRFWLGLWNYPDFSLIEKLIHVLIIGYPFALLFVYETIILLRYFLTSNIAIITIATFANAFLHEIPNTFAWEWVYTIPYVTFEILQINIVVILGWVILIIATLIIEKILKLPDY